MKVKFLPDGIEVEGKTGKTLLDLAFENDIILEHNCGGECACVACLVIVKEGEDSLNKVSPDEKFQLTPFAELNPDARLGCQCKIVNENAEKIVVEIPEFSNENED